MSVTDFTAPTEDEYYLRRNYKGEDAIAFAVGINSSLQQLCLQVRCEAAFVCIDVIAGEDRFFCVHANKTSEVSVLESWDDSRPPQAVRILRCQKQQYVILLRWPKYHF